jgi:hypothetical protein
VDYSGTIRKNETFLKRNFIPRNLLEIDTWLTFSPTPRMSRASWQAAPRKRGARLVVRTFFFAPWCWKLGLHHMIKNQLWYFVWLSTKDLAAFLWQL